ncbi:MAG: formylmethanofuran dehydrogenase subunit A [Betaproteobacteria bacterium TMED156]|nr:MAG: formylmethanofuran dehydrogenase subunit A [Betaproteobacteria bacterium TMED156]
MNYRLKNGLLVDPSQGLDHVNKCIFIKDEKIVEKLDSTDKFEDVDCTDMIVMAGGIDMHTHIGGGKTNLARMLLPEDHYLNRGSSNSLEIMSSGCCTPGTLQAGYRYTEMGYTAAFEPAMIFSNARQAHMEMGDTPILDHGAYVMLGNDELFLQMLAKKKPHEMIRDYVSWSIDASKSMGVKVVNPGGISSFKFNQRFLDVDQNHDHWQISPRKILKKLALCLKDIGVPHPLHIHASNLGVPGNIKSTIETIDALEGLPGHLTHVQFHTYGKEGPKKFSSAARKLVEKLKTSPNITIDVGQIIFGQTVTASGDTMKQHGNSDFANPKKWVLGDIECEAGCGVVPFKYKEESFVNALQWVIGLEIFLLMDDPWRVVLTTDHPNGGPFTSYPHLIKLLTNKSFRDEQLNKLHPDVVEHSDLSEIKRELSLYEIAILTRSAPAKILGLSQRGNLKNESFADIAVYSKNSDTEEMFRKPKLVFKNGRLVCNDGRIVSVPVGGVHVVKTSYESNIKKYIAKFYEQNMASSFSNAEIGKAELQVCSNDGKILTTNAN